ncbi:TauD/TfdA family dioxygenase [Longimicrobium sp.]|uniref:TauD/TfdA family dioxygenase n=1 Tax=Longimicrobium sp. TaxID=2029185 RepID=UPI002C2619DB|nr:TauD/TfdA family dioxygenase [Longimicrobium sp.]HSU16581.1 TauD/TfdA family dioxygenase [Longimicrobium sp.]
MIEGTFLERMSDPHVAGRRALLEAGPVLPAPSAPVRAASAEGFPRAAEAEIRDDLRARGLAVVQLDEPVPADRFLALGRLLGTAMPETDPAVQPQVEQQVILHLVSRHGHTRDVALQPFATQALTLHTESSARPAAAQPRYIVLMCRDPGDDATAAQTVLVPMAEVRARITPEQLALLASTRYRNSASVPFIVRHEEGRVVFSFRDFHEHPLDWAHAAPDAAADDVNGALRGLLAAMYAPEGATGIHWNRGMLVIMDNTFHFHGRTAGAVNPSSRPRHLQRLRIIAPP